MIQNSKTSNTEYTTPGNFENIIKKLATRKAPMDDLITNCTLKNLPNSAILHLTNIVNGCIRLGYFPENWKLVIIITIPKPDKDPLLPVNYRPIALLSSLSKILEKVILYHLKKENTLKSEMNNMPSVTNTRQRYNLST